VLQQMIGKKRYRYLANGIDNNRGALYGEKIHFDGTHLWAGHYRHSKLKSLVMVEKLAFQLRSEEWLTSTVVKIRYLILIPKQSNAESHFWADHT
jgi:DNA polymerase-4